MKTLAYPAWLGFIFFALIASALAVSYWAHLNRRAFHDWQQLEAARDQLQTEWGQLLLEQSALSAYSRVEQLARKQLHMKAPDQTELRLLRVK